MTADCNSTLRERVENFLYREAALLDEWRLDDWVELFSEDARYVVPTTDLPQGDPKHDMVFINDDITRLRARAERLKSRHAHRENPRSRTRRFISNVRVRETGNRELSVTSNVLVYRFRAGDGAPYVGHIDYTLRQCDGALKIAYRRAVLDMETLSSHGALSVIF